ncbi:MAG: hypothetical protein RIS76_4100 [Verrucomicrobiota bacterium]
MSGGTHPEGSRITGPTWSLAGCLCVGTALGVTFSVLPLELVILGVPLALGIGLLFCLAPSRRYRLGGYIPTLGIALSVMIGAGFLPTKRLDRPVGEFPNKNVTMGELVRREVAYELSNPAGQSTSISLPTIHPSQRQILDAINQQTQLRASVFRCGNGSTLVWGSSIGRIRINTPTQRAAQSTL